MRADRILFENEYFTVARAADEPIVTVTRSSRPFPSASETTKACEPMLSTLDRLGREQHYLLLDSRDAVGNNDPAYESWFAEVRKKLVAGFPRTAVLIKTLAGQMHSRRLLTEDEANAKSGVFADPFEAKAFLRREIRQSRLPKRHPAASSARPSRPRFPPS